ncbi:hypothetical protein LCGC14_1743300, partial [marine sediment metagenome]
MNIIPKKSDPVDWIEKHFYVSEPVDILTGRILPPGPIRLSESQKKIIREALRRNEEGNFIYGTILYSCPKKSGKTALATAVVIYLAMEVCFMDSIYLLANDGKQAEDRMLGALKDCIDLNKRLGGPLAHLTYTLSKIRVPNGTVIEALPCDPSGEAGSEPRFTFWSELWGFSSAYKHKERLWCFDDETEILTRTGWKFHDELEDDDEYLTYNRDTKKQEWQYAESIFSDYYDGEMYRCESRDVDILVTPGHKFYGNIGYRGHG